MNDKFKDKSSDELVRQIVDTINELSDRCIGFFHRAVDTYGKMREKKDRIKGIIRTIKHLKRGDEGE